MQLRQRYGIPGRSVWLLFAACMLLVVAAAHVLYLQSWHAAERSFHQQAKDRFDNIRGRLRQQEQMLWGGATLFALGGAVNRQVWQTYVQHLNLAVLAPGVQGVGYGAVVPAHALTAHERAVQRQGHASYAVHPAGARDTYVPVIYLEPFEGQRPAALGYDMLAEASRARALRRAADSGQASITAKIALIQEAQGPIQSGFLMAVPVYRSGQPLETVAQRNAALQGFVYSPNRINDLMKGIMGAGDQAPDFVVYDGDAESAMALMYDSQSDRAVAASRVAQFEAVHVLADYGRHWRVRFRSGAAAEVAWLSPTTGLVLGLGGAFSVVLLLIVAAYERRRQYAEARGQDVMQALRSGEQRAQENAEFMQSMLDNAVDGIITIDERGIVQSCNRAAERIFIYRAQDVIGRNVSMLMPEPYRAQHDGYIENYRKTGVAKIIGIGREVVGLRSNGTVFPMELAVSRNIRHGKAQFVGFVRDISERKRVERMKGEFVSTVSHELRTPLTSISGALGLLCGGALGDLSDQVKTMLDVAYRNSQRLTVLINDLLDMEKLAADKMRFEMAVQPLTPMVAQAIESMRGYAQQFDVTMVLDSQVEDLQVRVDSGRLQQVLGNLLSNAAKYSPSGAQVRVVLRRLGRNVRVDVIDQGPGLDPGFRDRIFQKFSQADSSDTRKKGGTGLGLAISKELIERMGGLIGFESTPGQGATFHFELPVIEEDVCEIESGPYVPDDRKRILVIEDDPDIAQLMQLMLARAGYAADTASSGRMALELIAQRHYDALTLDLLLPDLSGVSLLQRLRDKPETEKLPVIIVSAFIDDGKLAISGEFEALHWLEKPIGEGDLLQAVSRSLDVTQRGRVLHVEDDLDLCRVVATLGSEFADFDAVHNLAQAREKLSQGRYDVVILDVGLPDGSGLSLMPCIEAQQPRPRVVVLSGSDLTKQQLQGVQQAITKNGSTGQALLTSLQQALKR